MPSFSKMANFEESDNDKRLTKKVCLRFKDKRLQGRVEASRHARFIRKWRWWRRLAFGCRVIDPYSRVYFVWLMVITCAVLYNFVLLIFRSAFWDIQAKCYVFWLTLDYVSDALYALDMFVKSKTGYFEGEISVQDSNSLLRNYASTLTFRLDVLSLLPTDLAYLLPPATVNRPFVRFNRLLRVPRLFEFIDRSETRSNHPFAVRTVQLLVITLTVIHWNACVYVLLSEWIGVASDGWVYQTGGDSRGEKSPYVYSLFWSTLMLLTIGNLPPPETNLEIAIVTVDFLIGILLFAAIIGSFSGLIANRNAERREFQQKEDAVKRYMKMRGVSSDLQMKVSKWFDYMWTNRRSMEEENVLDILPETIKAEIATEVHLEALKRVSIFETCEKDLLTKLVVRLRSVVYSPGDYVCHMGDIGTEMYIVKEGLLNVLGDNGQTVYATICDGGFFGEVSLLNISGNRRVADVVSIGFSDIFVLSKDDLWNTLDEYPETRRKLIDAGKDRLQKGNMHKKMEEAKENISPSSSLSNQVVAMEKKLYSSKEFLIKTLADFAIVQRQMKRSAVEMENKT